MVQARVAMVTGCSSGIGLVTARHLRGSGWRVVTTARRREDLERLRAEGFEAVALDLSDAESVRAAVDEVLQVTGGVLGALVNNAGYGQPGALEDLSREDLRMQLDVNVVGLQDLTNRLIPVFRRQGWGRIVNVSSVAGRLPLPLLGAYSVSKHALEAMSDCLRIELRDAGIAVSIIEPAAVDTAIFDKAVGAIRKLLSTATNSPFAEVYRRHTDSNRRAKRSHRAMAKPEVVAQAIRRALESCRPRRRYPVTAAAWVVAFLRRAAPTALVDRVLHSRMGLSRAPE